MAIRGEAVPDRRYADSMPLARAMWGAPRAPRAREPRKERPYPGRDPLGCGLENPELSLSTCAYNRWIADFCRDSDGRLVPIAHVSLLDPTGAADELERAVRDGCKGAFVAPFTHTRKAHGHPDHDALFARAESLGVPIAIHPTHEPFWAAPVRFKRTPARGSSRDARQGVRRRCSRSSRSARSTASPACGPASSSPARAGSARSSTARTPWPRRGRASRSG
jgi:hypothetical protein